MNRIPDLNAALEFYCEVVEPTVRDFEAAPHDRRLGSFACIALSAMAEHYFYAFIFGNDDEAQEKGEFLRELCADNYAFARIRDVANATKHVRPTRGIGYRHISAKTIHLGNLRCNMPFSGNMLFVEAESGASLVLLHLVNSVDDMWQERLGARLPPLGRCAA